VIPGRGRDELLQLLVIHTQSLTHRLHRLALPVQHQPPQIQLTLSTLVTTREASEHLRREGFQTWPHLVDLIRSHDMINDTNTLELKEIHPSNEVLLVGWDDTRSVELFAGSSTSSTEPARALEPVIAAARRSPHVASLLRAGALPDEVLAADPGFAETFTEYQRRFGCRALTYDLADPTLAERPAVMLGLIRDQLNQDAEDAQAAARQTADRALAEARRILSDRDSGARARFERDLARARAAYPVREDNEFFTISTPLAVLRQVALEIGRRLAGRRQVDAADDVFFFEVPEMLAALRDGDDQRGLIRRRRGERACALAHPGPPTYGRDPAHRRRWTPYPDRHGR
jgi:pyruvate,water dikinase